MYSYTSEELQVLSDLINGQVILGTPEYDHALSVYVTNSPPLDEQQIIRFNQLLSGNSEKPHAAFYDFAADFAARGGTSSVSDSIAWLRGAAGVNRGDSIASDFIRDYTSAQVEARTGQDVSDATLQSASNAIALEVFATINISGELPEISIIGENDALTAMAGLEDAGLASNPAIWSGNILFPGLGDSSFFHANIIETPGDTYDLVTAAYSVSQAGYGAFLGAGLSSVWTLFSNGGSAVGTASAAATFINEAYGSEGTLLPLAFMATANIVVGQETNSDTLGGINTSDLIHGGGGNDIITGSGGSDIIDGGNDFDTIDYSTYAASAGIHFYLYSDDNAAANFVGTAIQNVSSGAQYIDVLFNIESIVGSDHADTFHVRDDFSNGMLIIGAGNGANDTGE